MINQERQYKLLKALERRPFGARGQLLIDTGLSRGKTRYLIKSVLDTDWVKYENFQCSGNNWGYAYLLTPSGIIGKAHVTAKFLNRKEREIIEWHGEFVWLKKIFAKTNHRLMRELMANYKIYGVGAALVDTEVRVSDDFLARFCIQKGLMTLVDELRQYELINALTLHECYMLKKSGGSVCNSVVAASSLGAKSFFSGKVASDLDGELFHQDLKDVGVDFKRVKTDAAVTGKCLVMVTDDAERTMNTFLGVSQQLSLEDINYDALCDSEWLYLEGYLATDNVRSELAKNLIKTAKSNGVKTSLSLSDPFVVTTFGDALREIIADGVDLIFCNNAEAIAFTKCSTIEEAIKDLKQYSKRFVVTDGENGAFVFDGQEGIISKGIKTSAIDTNGAGDMFAGAFLYALTSGRSYAWAANLANFCASRVVSQFGPRLGDKDFKAIKTFIDLNS